MSTKISALPAASAPNITDATVVPLVDANTMTVKATVAQLRTQLSAGAGTATHISVPTATPTTLFALPVSGGAFYLVRVFIVLATSVNHAYAFVSADGAGTAFTSFGFTSAGGVITALTVSGANVQVTQTSGITQLCNASYTCFGFGN